MVSCSFSRLWEEKHQFYVGVPPSILTLKEGRGGLVLHAGLPFLDPSDAVQLSVDVLDALCRVCGEASWVESAVDQGRVLLLRQTLLEQDRGGRRCTAVSTQAQE